MTVTIVCGPPGSGKSSYVRERSQRGDLTVDLDALACALSGCPSYDQPEGILDFALHCQYACINALAIGTPMRHAWVIVRGAFAAERRQLHRLFDAQVVVLAVPADECLRRIGHDEARCVVPYSEWERRVRGWWAAYEQEAA